MNKSIKYNIFWMIVCLIGLISTISILEKSFWSFGITIVFSLCIVYFFHSLFEISHEWYMMKLVKELASKVEVCAYCGIMFLRDDGIDCPECKGWFCDNCYDTGAGDGCYCHGKVIKKADSMINDYPYII